MAKYSSDDIRKIAERLKSAHERGRPAHFLIGAGCSISAGIPSAGDLVKRIHKEYPAHCADLPSGQHDAYGACMGLLSRNERRDLIIPYLENAKINWGTIALAQLIVKGLVGRVLTVNFDLVLENACGLLGLQPAVYDFGVAPANDLDLIVSPAIIHMHGQSYGLVLLNTDDETRKHRQKLRPIISDTLRSAPLIVTGYSGSADGIFQTLLDEFAGHERLYWASFEDDIQGHVAPFLEKEHFQFIGGADFDRFMIELAQALGCWPPSLFSSPLRHLLDELSPVVAYPVMDTESSIDLLGDLRRKLESWQNELGGEEAPTASLQELFMRGRFQEAVNQFSTRADHSADSSEDREIVAWSLIKLGNVLLEQAKGVNDDEAAHLFAAAGEKYAEALAIKPDKPEALNNWGILLSEQAKRTSGDEAARLFAAADKKFAAAVAVKPDKDETLYNWGNLLLEQARRAGDDEAARLFAAAGEKYAAALAVKPEDHEALRSWGILLVEQAKRASADEAARLFAVAGEKCAAALAVKPDYHEALSSLGVMLLEQAKRTSGDEAARMFAEAREKLTASAKIAPSNTYNLACLAALTGDEIECRHNLENAEKCGTLPRSEHLIGDTDLDSVRAKPWFLELLERQKHSAKP